MEFKPPYRFDVRVQFPPPTPYVDVMELVDMTGSNPVGNIAVWVQIPSSTPI